MAGSGKTQRISNELDTIIIRLKETIKDKQGIELSYSKASKVLADRIEKAGGLRV